MFTVCFVPDWHKCTRVPILDTLYILEPNPDRQIKSI